VNDVDRTVRAAIYRLLVSGEPGPTTLHVAGRTGLEPGATAEAFHRLAAEHRLVLVPGEDRVAMAHPFSGVPTGYRAMIGERTWWANCGWDAFGILALLGDGTVHAGSPTGAGSATWSVEDGKVSPDGLVHFVVPARHFWDDIGFT